MSAPLDPQLRRHAEAARGFLPPDEGEALYAAAMAVDIDGPLVEIGAYCGKSTIYLGAAARERSSVLLSIDHHRGSEENQAGWRHHEPDLVDPLVGALDTLPTFRATVRAAGLEPWVVAIVGESSTVAATCAPAAAAFVFIDGGHGIEPAHRDYECWAPRVALGGSLGIHDVFPDPADGGRPPYEIYERALASGRFVEASIEGSLRVLRRVV